MLPKIFHLGNLNCPSSVPSEPKVVRTLPLTSKIWMQEIILYFDDYCPHLKSMIVRVGNDDTICVADGDVMWMLKLSGLAAHRAKLGHESAVALENLTRRKVGRIRPGEGQSTNNYDYEIRDISKEDKDLDPVIFFVAYVDESQ